MGEAMDRIKARVAGGKAKPSRNGTRKPASNGGDFGDGIPKWEPPTPLPTMPPVSPFPLTVFPPQAADYWQAVAAMLGCPVDYVAVPGMTLLGAAAGRSRAAEVKPGYHDVPLFWTATFAPPGSVKSPALRFARAPLQRSEQRWMDEHREARELFDTETEKFNAAMKAWKADGCKGEPPEKPRKPTLRQATLDDTTTEAAARVLAENHRGICVVKDELIGFVKAQNQYRGGKGADREFWLSAWAGAPAKVNRLKDHDQGPLYIPHPFVAIAGMLCPDSLSELRGENRHGDAPADGFLDRFLLSFPDPVDAAPEAWRTVPADVEDAYCDVFLDLLGLELVPEQVDPKTVRHRPYFVRLSHEGRSAWGEFTGDIAARMNALEPFDPFKGVLSKLKGYAVRFAALLWCLRRVCGGVEADAPIGADILAGAGALVSYFESHAARCLGRGWADGTSRIAKRLVGWLERNPPTKTFTRTEAFQFLKDKRTVRDSETLLPALRRLTDHGYIRPLTRPENMRPGPVPETYIVNPQWTREV